MSWGVAAAAAANAGMSYLNTSAANAQSKAAASRAMNFEEKMMYRQMEFQKGMSDSAHAREVADLRNAGLNPILSANAGASTPGGAMAGGSSYTAQKAETEIDPLLLAQERQMAQSLKQAKATTENINVDTGLKAANTKSAEKDLEIKEESKKLLQAQTAKEGENARISRQNADLLDKYGNASQIMGLINAGTGSIGNLMGVSNLLKGLLGPKHRNTVKENYSSQGEHLGTTHTRTYND